MDFLVSARITCLFRVFIYIIALGGIEFQRFSEPSRCAVLKYKDKTEKKKKSNSNPMPTRLRGKL